MKPSELLKRLEYAVKLGNVALSHKMSADYSYYVPIPEWSGFRAAGLSFIENLYGNDSTFYKAFANDVNNTYVDNINSGLNILDAVKHEIENGWLFTIKALVTAEVFSDFLEMSEHLLSEGYKDAAAVMIGSTLEEHLRQLCCKHDIETTFLKAGDLAPKKADVLNADLKKAEIYGPIEQKLVTAWLGLRNSAAHGKYDEYTKAQVEGMYQGVLAFISQTK